MKKTIYSIIVLLIGLAGLTGCEDFLDVQSKGANTVDQYFQNDYQAQEALDGIYAYYHQEGGFGREFFWEQGGANDVVWGKSRSYPSLATFKYTGEEGPLTDVFERFEYCIQRANWIIDGLLEKEETQQLTKIENRSLGEAYFLRGFMHFYIAYRYGTGEQGVPFTRWEDYPDGYDNSIPEQQATVMENYKLIVEDMDNAIKRLPRFEEYDAANRGRAHQAAAVGYKAKVYAYWAAWDKSKWQQVIEMVNELETKYGRGLADTYNELFSSDFEDFWGREYIWTIPSNGGSQGGGTEFPGVVLENKGWGVYNGWGQNKPSLDIYEELLKDGVGNIRLTRSILEYGQKFMFFGEERRFYGASDLESGFQINKYMDPFGKKDPIENGFVHSNGNFPTARINFPLLRFADVLLLRAEAYLMTGNAAKATQDINRVRVRSELAPLAGTATTADLYHERRCELAFEFSDHLYDLKRWHLSGDATLKSLAEKELNSHPRVRVYEERDNPDSPFTVQPYEDYRDRATYQDHMIAFPYPSYVITKSNGKLKQNKGYAQ
ncbi:MAG: RagB/SusD family nutrient uptake outer membrane protein [Porphyromonas sp.]|nr:RagB/SusD family nutrient uptake outer membrane protein [Porphyromonas sp.]